MKLEHRKQGAEPSSQEHPREAGGRHTRHESSVGAGYVGRAGTLLVSLYFVALLIALLHMLVSAWPDPASATSSQLFGITVRMDLDRRLFVIVLASGALGGILYALRSLGWYIGNRNLRWSWIPRYALLPLTGGTLALVFYLVLRAGFVSTQAAGEASTFSFAALGSLVGLFSEQAILKLKGVAETLLSKGEQGKDAYHGKGEHPKDKDAPHDRGADDQPHGPPRAAEGAASS